MLFGRTHGDGSFVLLRAAIRNTRGRFFCVVLLCCYAPPRENTQHKGSVPLCYVLLRAAMPAEHMGSVPLCSPSALFREHMGTVLLCYCAPPRENTRRNTQHKGSVPLCYLRALRSPMFRCGKKAVSGFRRTRGDGSFVFFCVAFTLFGNDELLTTQGVSPSVLLRAAMPAEHKGSVPLRYSYHRQHKRLPSRGPILFTPPATS